MPKKYLLSELANMLGIPFKGDDIEIHGVSTLSEASQNELSFLSNPKYASQVENTQAGAVILLEEHADKVQNALISPEPYAHFAYCIHLFADKEGSFEGISSFASLHPEAVIGENCTIYPFVYISAKAKIGDNCRIFSGCYIGENVEIGDNCTLYPNSVLMSGTVLGCDCTIQPGAVLGGEGFGFIRHGGAIHKIPQIGTVQLGNNVEIGCNATIDRAALTSTRVGNGTCIDNLVQLGHNVQVGENTFIIAQVGVAGSTIIGDNCTLAGQVGIAGHLNIGDNVTIGAQAGVMSNIEAGRVVSGSPTMDYQTYMRNGVCQPKLPDLFKRVSKLEKALAELEAQKKTEE